MPGEASWGLSNRHLIFSLSRRALSNHFLSVWVLSLLLSFQGQSSSIQHWREQERHTEMRCVFWSVTQEWGSWWPWKCKGIVKLILKWKSLKSHIFLVLLCSVILHQLDIVAGVKLALEPLCYHQPVRWGSYWRHLYTSKCPCWNLFFKRFFSDTTWNLPERHLVKWFSISKSFLKEISYA